FQQQSSQPQSSLSPAALVGIGMVFAGCCSNVFFLELIIKEAPSSGNIVTFFQFLFIAAHGFVTTAKFGRARRAIPLSYYALMVSMFFVVQVVNNYALNFNISMPLHMIFRSGSLMANLVLGVLILNKSYPLSKYASVLVITAGIVVCTIESASDARRPPADEAEAAAAASEQVELLRWCLGVLMLVFALFMSARMGIFQEETYRKYGKHPDESLFYNHCLPLPGFLLLSADIWQHVRLFSESAPMWPLPVPRLWVWLAGNVLTQYLCIRGVFILTTECSSLTVTLVVTLRKFSSLIFSIFYFNNRFTGMHWLGTICVFGGTLIFTETHQRLRNLLLDNRKKS
uniref:S35B4 protein n=2 Tax=Macrostomum lignano TaxID=282301 RepID=A0A1I8IFL4_9PLAT